MASDKKEINNYFTEIIIVFDESINKTNIHSIVVIFTFLIFYILTKFQNIGLDTNGKEL